MYKYCYSNLGAIYAKGLLGCAKTVRQLIPRFYQIDNRLSSLVFRLQFDRRKARVTSWLVCSSPG